MSAALTGVDASTLSAAISNHSVVDYNAITKLEAEPQEGPVEYKLHLLLRRRRSFTRTSTGRHVSLSGSLRRLEPATPPLVGRSASESGLANTPPPSASTQSRQHRLHQLTTQLLWRLQQSIPNHVSSSTPLTVPQLPDDAQLTAPAVPQQLLPGLEESKGALYEIGVADDGTFIGLVNDEMEESLNNLRAMAASLGCRVDVLRMVQVGECEWFEHGITGASRKQIQTGKLWVAEALVQPDQDLINTDPAEDIRAGLASQGLPGNTPDSLPPSAGSAGLANAVEELRVSLTGATRSGKSSLLGSLSTATLDDGRGKSRLSLLKHRHEIVSGITSSVTQELIGYQDATDHAGSRTSTQVISYGARDVSSWIDIHASAAGGRLVFLSDSAGHPRYRRTTVRGLVGWDPHWTCLCIPADNTEDSTGRIGLSPASQEILGPASGDVDLSRAHLQLCLNLELPLLVVITKYDLATKPGLRQTLSRLLSAIKDAGRKPCIVGTTSASISETELNTIGIDDLLEVAPIVQQLQSNPLAVVPIILTSSVKGIGIRRLHAFLRELPIPSLLDPTEGAPHALFYIEDIYSNILAPTTDPSLVRSPSQRSVVLGGHVRYGALRIGDELLLGPYPVDTASDDSDSGSGRGSTPPNRSQRNAAVPASRSFPGALNKGRSTLRSGLHPNEKHAEWRRVRITSIRNMRLPVRSLQAGHVGTIAVAPLDLPIASPAIVRIRKGMVLMDGEPKANRVIAVKFTGSNAEAVTSLSVGSGVVVYVASVRASAKVVSVTAEHGLQEPTDIVGRDYAEDEDAGFGFGFDADDDETLTDAEVAGTTIVTFQFIASREFVEMNAKVLVLPGGGPGLYGGTERGEKGVAGLEGFVGRVIDGS